MCCHILKENDKGNVEPSRKGLQKSMLSWEDLLHSKETNMTELPNVLSLMSKMH